MRSQTLLGLEAGNNLTHRPDPEGAGDDVDNPVDMVQRQKFQDAVSLGPAPGLHQTGDLGGDVLMGRDHPLGLARGAAGIENHGPPRRRHRRQRTGGVRQGLGARPESEPALGRNGPDQVGIIRMGHDHGGLGIINDVFQLRPGMEQGQRHGNAAGPPDAPLQGDVMEALRRQEGHRPLVQVLAAVQEKGRHPAGGLQELPVGKTAFRGHDRRAFAILFGPRHE